MTEPSLLPVLGLASGVFAIGFAAIWVRLSEVGPLATAFWRLSLAAAFVALWGILFDAKNLKKISQKRYRPWLTKTAFAGLAFGADLAVWHLSIHRTSVAMATLFANFAPFFMLIGAVLFLGERLHPKALAGILVCALGITFLGIKNSNSGTTVTWSGNMMAIVAALFYAGYLILLKGTPKTDIPPLYTMGVASFFGAILQIPLVFFLESQNWIPSAPSGWFVLILMTLTAQVIGQGLITAFISRVSGELSSALLCLQSVFAAIAGFIILHERMVSMQIAGGISVLTGIFLVRLGSQEKKQNI